MKAKAFLLSQPMGFSRINDGTFMPLRKERPAEPIPGQTELRQPMIIPEALRIT